MADDAPDFSKFPDDVEPGHRHTTADNKAYELVVTLSGKREWKPVENPTKLVRV
jgi:hypothetical protein